MSSTPDSLPENCDGVTESEPARRIPIGTQRQGVKPPQLPARHQYIVGPQALPTDSALPTDPAVPIDTAGPTDTAGLTTASVATPSTVLKRNATDTPAANEPAVPPTGTDRGQPRERRRDGRGGPAKKPSLEGTLPQQKRVAIPNLREALEDDLESDFQAALAGVSIDDLLTVDANARAETPLEPGARVTGTVLAIGVDTAFIDLGGRRQGALKLAGMIAEDAELPTVGQTLSLSVGTRSEEDGLYDVAFANRAVSVEDWSQIQAGMIVEARVTGSNKGGLECEVGGLRGFMPASLISPWRMENLAELIGQTLESLVTEIVPAARKLVLSRRAVVERLAADARTKMLETLEIGETLEGIVRSVRDFGAFVDIGNGVDGLVHVSQLSWDRVETPADLLTLGQKINVVVKKIDRQTGKIGLSVRDLVASPWKHAGEKYHLGATVRGTVSRIAQFGAFVKLEPGIEGLVHVSEIASRHIRSVGDVIKEGEAVECRVLSIDPDEQRISLSIKALIPLPTAESRPENRDSTGADQAPTAEEPQSARSFKPSKPSRPLKGGLGGTSLGDRFGLTW